jgi:hypothetical protein
MDHCSAGREVVAVLDLDVGLCVEQARSLSVMPAECSESTSRAGPTLRHP